MKVRNTKPWLAEAFWDGGYEVVPPEDELAYCLRLLEQEYLIRPERYELVKRGAIEKYPELEAKVAELEPEWQKWRSRRK